MWLGVDIPVEAVAKILKEQDDWDKKRVWSGSKENIHKRLEQNLNKNSYYGHVFKKEPRQEG